MIPGADSERLRRLLTASLPTGTRAAELFIESRLTLSIELDAATGAPRVERRRESGAHLRRFFEGRHESFVLDAPGPDALEALVQHPGSATSSVPEATLDPDAEILPEGPWNSRHLDRALALVQAAMSAAQSASGWAPGRSFRAALRSEAQEILVISTERETARDTRTSVDVQIEGESSDGTPWLAARRSAPSLEPLESEAWGKRGARELLERMGTLAVGAPGGEMPVVFAPPSGGLLLHEICGHLLEADHVLAGESPFAGARGEAVASPLLSLADDGSIPGLRGSAQFDDEGIPSRRTPLIVKGTLVGYLSSRMTAHATDRISTGNGRRESYRDAPLPRMTNLVIDPGAMTCDEIIASTGYGLLVRRLGRGQVNPNTGRFLLVVEDGLLIESGVATRPVTGAVLHGVARQALAAIDAVGADVTADPSGVICLKEDQAIPFGTLQPTLRVSSLSVAAAPS